MSTQKYSSVDETRRISDLIISMVQLPAGVEEIQKQVSFTATLDSPYFPIPFKETEVTAALKSIEGSLAKAIQDLRDGSDQNRRVTVDLEKTTAFLFQAYLAKVGGFGKLDSQVKKFLKDTDLLQAQSDPYRRMSANLYQTKQPGEYYHIHGSLDASTTLGMIGLEPFRPDLKNHEAIVDVIESHVQNYTVEELEALNAYHQQAGVPAYKHNDFLLTPHGKQNAETPPWIITSLESSTPPRPFSVSADNRVLSGIKVLELCRIIAGPVIGRILAEYGADVLKITSPNLSDVPFFQVDGNMGKHAADLDLKTAEGRATFEQLLAEADVILDGYRPGTLERLGYGTDYLTSIAKSRGYGVVYVNENCFGYEGEWAHRPGWQQIADCVTGVAWKQGQFMGLDEPVVPPFPISDYGTGCMGAIAALSGLLNRATSGGSWHGKTSLMHYDLLLFKAGEYSSEIQERLRAQAGRDFLALRHSHSVDQISGTALRRIQELFPGVFNNDRILEAWYSGGYGAVMVAVKPVVEIEGVNIGFKRASRPNGTDAATWEFGEEKDYRIDDASELSHITMAGVVEG